MAVEDWFIEAGSGQCCGDVSVPNKLRIADIPLKL